MKINSVFKKLFINSTFITGRISDELYVKILFAMEFGYVPDLKSPKTFNEKICSRKISDGMLENWKYTDKYEVKKYVSETIGDEHLIRCLGCYNSFSDIDFSSLPQSFVLKATHSSGHNILVKDKEKFNAVQAKEKFDRWLKVNYYNTVREKNYKPIVPRLLVEDYLDLSKYKEFKLFCFNGHVRFFTTNHYTDKKRYSNIYNASGELLPIKWGYENYPDAIIDKKVLGELVCIAEKLAQPFDFVRVDLYSDNESILFSELTFNPGSGYVRFSPPEYDKKFGEFFNQ